MLRAGPPAPPWWCVEGACAGGEHQLDTRGGQAVRLVAAGGREHQDTMVDLSAGGPDGPLEHGFSNSVFVFPGIVTVGLAGKSSTSPLTHHPVWAPLVYTQAWFMAPTGTAIGAIVILNILQN